jgi:MFS family permease
MNEPGGVAASGHAPEPAQRLTRIAAVVLLPFAGGYFMSYLFRTVNAVIAPHLIRDLHLTAADLGLLTAAYFIAFAAFQIPLGVLLDRFGPRRVQAGLLLFMAAGAAAFAIGGSLLDLVAGRALIGLGASASLMASLKAITQWFPREKWALINGVFIGCGGLGALVATTPLELALRITDWRGVFLALSAIVLVISAAIFTVVPDKPIATDGQSLRQQMASVWRVLGDATFWRVTPLATTLYASSMSMQGLWLGPFSRDVLASPPAPNLQLVAIGFTLGAIGTGVLSDRLQRAGYSLFTVMGVLTPPYVATLTPFIWPFMGDHPAIWLAFGGLANVAAISYAIVPAYFPLSYAGRANTALNLVIFGFAFAMQYAIGGIIDMWPRSVTGAYAPEGYQAAFLAAAGTVVLTLAWYFVPVRDRA